MYEKGNSQFPSLHSKCCSRFFRTFEALFAFWPRKNWGEGKNNNNNFIPLLNVCSRGKVPLLIGEML